MNVHEDLLQQAANAAILEECPTDQVTSEVEQVIHDADDCSDELLEGSRNLEDLVETTVSLESFVEGFLDRVPSGEWNAKYARQFQIGVGNILAAAQVSVPEKLYCASFEAVNVTQTSMENRDETASKSKGLIARLWEAFKAACAKIAELLTSLVQNYGKSESALYKMRRNLEARIGLTHFNTKKKDHFDGSPKWAAYLQAGHATYTPKDALATVVSTGKIISDDWIEMYSKLAKTVCSQISSGKEVSEEELSKDHGHGNIDIYQFPGLKQITVGNGEGASNVFTSKITVTVDEANHVTPEPKVLSESEIKDIARGIGKIADHMGDVGSSLKRAIVDIKALSKEALKSKERKQGPAIVSKLLGRIGSGPRVLLPLMGGAAQQAFFHANASLRQYGNDVVN